MPSLLARAARHQELAFPARRAVQGVAPWWPGKGKDGDCSATLRPRWAVQTQSGECWATEAVLTSLFRGRECRHGGGPCLWDQAGKNASGKGREPGKLWPSGAKGSGPQRMVLAPGSTGQVSGRCYRPDLSLWHSTCDIPSLTLFFLVFSSPCSSQSRIQACLPEPVMLSRLCPSSCIILLGITYFPHSQLHIFNSTILKRARASSSADLTNERKHLWTDVINTSSESSSWYMCHTLSCSVNFMWAESSWFPSVTYAVPSTVPCK